MAHVKPGSSTPAISSYLIAECAEVIAEFEAGWLSGVGSAGDYAEERFADAFGGAEVEAALKVDAVLLDDFGEDAATGFGLFFRRDESLEKARIELLRDKREAVKAVVARPTVRGRREGEEINATPDSCIRPQERSTHNCGRY